MLFLPRWLGLMAKLCRTEETKYAVNCVRIIDPGDGSYRAEATDGRRLAIVRGPAQIEPSEYLTEMATTLAPFEPDLPGDKPLDALIPAQEWAKAFKLGLPEHKRNPVALTIGARNPDSTIPYIFASGTQNLHGRANDERFPPCNEALPKHPALVSARMDTKYLTSLLELFGAAGNSIAELLFFGPDKPLGLIAHTEDGHFLDGLQMPMTEN